MKALTPLLCIALFACQKAPHEVTYSAACDRCHIAYVDGSGDTIRRTVDSGRWRTHPDSLKILEVFIAKATLDVDMTPTLVIEHDSGYAFGSLRVGPLPQTARVYAGAQVLTHH